MFLFTNDFWNPHFLVIPQSFFWILQKSLFIRSLAWGHSRWQVNEPFGVRTKSAHHFQSGCRVFFTKSDRISKPGLNDTLSLHILHIEQIIVLLLSCMRYVCLWL